MKTLEASISKSKKREHISSSSSSDNSNDSSGSEDTDQEETVASTNKSKKKKNSATSSNSDSNSSSGSLEDADRKIVPSGRSNSTEDLVYEKIAQQTISDSYTNFSSLHSTTSKLSNYFETYKNLTKLKPKTDIPLPKFSKSIIYLMQIPRGLDHQDLINQEISLVDKTKLRVDGEKYLFTPVEEKPQPLTLLTSIDGKCCVKKGLLRGSIKVHRHFKHKTNRDTIDMSTSKVDFPTEIKVRHPIFGDNYVDEVELDNSIQQKLSESAQHFNMHAKKKKKKKKKEDKEEELKDEMIFRILENASHSEDLPKKKRKKKHKDKEVMSSTNNMIMHNGALSENSDEDSIQENFLRHKKQKTDRTLINTEDVFLTDTSTHVHKEKKLDKRKKEQKIKVLQNIVLTNAPESPIFSKGMKKTIGDDTVDNASTSLDVTNINFDSLDLHKLSKKEKKHYKLLNSGSSKSDGSLKPKSTKDVDINDSINSLIEKYCSSAEDDASKSSKKKKKKHKKHKEMHEKEDIINEKHLQSIPEDAVKVNKKKKRKSKEFSVNETSDKNESESDEEAKNTRNEILRNLGLSLGIYKKNKKH